MKTASITIRIDEKTKEKLMKLAKENRREFSDFVRLVLVDVAEKKIKPTF
jgi:antitoxin component of RelBE/YafQ-DinJ toxin-antitoxin module